MWPAALPLWWDGALVPEGWDRARRSIRPLVEHLDAYIQWRPTVPAGDTLGRAIARHDRYGLGRLLDRPDPMLGSVQIAAMVAACAGLASRVVLLDLVDGRLVERAP